MDPVYDESAGNRPFVNHFSQTFFLHWNFTSCAFTSHLIFSDVAKFVNINFLYKIPTKIARGVQKWNKKIHDSV